MLVVCGLGDVDLKFDFFSFNLFKRSYFNILQNQTNVTFTFFQATAKKTTPKKTKKDLTVLLNTRFHQQRKVPHLYHSDQDEEQGHSTDLEKPENTNTHCAIE